LKERLLTWPPDITPVPGETVNLEPDQARHGLLSLRLGVGQKLTLTGHLGLAPAEVTEADRKSLILKVRLLGPFESSSDPGPILVLPLIRPSRFDWAVEKAAELGASELWPLITARTRISEPTVGESKKARWRRLAQEARKQCARPTPLIINDILSWSNFTAALRTYKGPKLLPTLYGQSWPALEEPPLILIGPEGGFTDSEISELNNLEFWPLCLGPAILRTETAALAALSQWQTISSQYHPNNK
jgi:16S rRNA (uracil1498-N3)-methyltransferase